jgi:hypothetical protein
MSTATTTPDDRNYGTIAALRDTLDKLREQEGNFWAYRKDDVQKWRKRLTAHIQRHDTGFYHEGISTVEQTLRAENAQLRQKLAEIEQIGTEEREQRTKAQLVALRYDYQELEKELENYKTGSVPRTLGTPLDENQPEPVTLEQALEQVDFFIQQSDYLRLATTHQLVRFLTALKACILRYQEHTTDDGRYEQPLVNFREEVDAGNYRAGLIYDVIESLANIANEPSTRTKRRLTQQLGVQGLKDWLQGHYDACNLGEESTQAPSSRPPTRPRSAEPEPTPPTHEGKRPASEEVFSPRGKEPTTLDDTDLRLGELLIHQLRRSTNAERVKDARELEGDLIQLRNPDRHTEEEWDYWLGDFIRILGKYQGEFQAPEDYRVQQILRTWTTPEELRQLLEKEKQ